MENTVKFYHSESVIAVELVHKQVVDSIAANNITRYSLILGIRMVALGRIDFPVSKNICYCHSCNKSKLCSCYKSTATSDSEDYINMYIPNNSVCSITEYDCLSELNLF